MCSIDARAIVGVLIMGAVLGGCPEEHGVEPCIDQVIDVSRVYAARAMCYDPRQGMTLQWNPEPMPCGPGRVDVIVVCTCR